MKNLLRSKRRNRGAALVEFAIILPLLLVILIGILEFGLLFYNKQIITNASREAARAGIAYSDYSQITSIVQQYCQNRMITFGTPSIPIVEFDPTSGPPSYPSNLKVIVKYDYDLLMPTVLGLGTDFQLISSTIMRMEKSAI